MRSKLAIPSWLAVALIASGCGSSAATTDLDSGVSVDSAVAVDPSMTIDSGLPVTPDADGGPNPAAAGGRPGTDDAAANLAPVADAEAADGRTSDGRGGASAADASGGQPADAHGGADGSLPVASGAGDASTPPTSAFTCTLLIGIQATEEWYTAGFETMVDNSRWELIWVHSGFVELWANPADPIWSTGITSPCAQGGTQPDRVIFVPLNYNYTTLAEWTPAITAAVANIHAKYSSAKRIELMTFIRAPGNVACPQAPAPRSTITQAQDEAMAAVAAANPGLVVVAPRFEVKTCNEFSSNPPHPTTAGAGAWATMMASYYR
jgi:hypothetical protein